MFIIFQSIRCHRTTIKPKFKIGDKVRISKYKRKVFYKWYPPNWTEEIFTIDSVKNTQYHLTHDYIVKNLLEKKKVDKLIWPICDFPFFLCIYEEEIIILPKWVKHWFFFTFKSSLDVANILSINLSFILKFSSWFSIFLVDLYQAEKKI